MSYIDLIILGYLQSGEKSAYEMVKEFNSWNLHHWLKISDPSIYKNIIKLCDKGYLNSRTIKETEMPEKTIYSINEKGLSYFCELMEHCSKNLDSIYFPFNAFLINVERLPKEKRFELLGNLREKILQANKLMKYEHEKQKSDTHKPDSAFLLMDLYADFYNLLGNWSEKVLNHYNNK